MLRVKEPVDINSSEKTHWTVKDVARYLGISAEAVYCWVDPKKRGLPEHLKKNPLPVYKFGHRQGIRFPIKEFLIWVEKGKMKRK